MPKLETQTRKVQDARKTDIVTWNGEQHVITSTTTKTKFVYLETSTEATLRIEHGTDVEVTREVPTTEEKRDSLIENVLWEADHTVGGAYRRLAEARSKLTAIFEKDYVASSFDIGSLISAQAEVEVNAHLPRTDDDEHTDAEKIKVIKAVIAHWTERLLENGLMGHSTSMISNVMDDATREAASKLVSGFSSLGMYVRHLDQIEAELATEREHVADGFLNG